MINMGIIVINPYAVAPVSSGFSAVTNVRIADSPSETANKINLRIVAGRSVTNVLVGNGETVGPSGSFDVNETVNVGNGVTIKTKALYTVTDDDELNNLSFAWGTGSGNTNGWAASYTGNLSDLTISVGDPDASDGDYDDYSFMAAGTESGETLTLSITCTVTNDYGSSDSSQFSFSVTFA